MDPRLQQAAKSGSIDELYALIDENPYILENIDAVPFINTPLHVAAASGNIEFAMEMLNLKPSLARKLNTSGYSPLHLAVETGHTDFVSWMLKHDHSLACLNGRNGMIPFHLVVVRGNVDLVAECLLVSPECIRDVSVNGRNALHLAVVNDRYEVLQVLTGWIKRTMQRNAFKNEFCFLNKEDFSYNTALHLAAQKNDLQAVRLLLECQHVERNKVNGDGLTFLDILRNLENSGDWDLDLEQVIIKTRCKEAASMPKPKSQSHFLKSPFTFWTFYSTGMKRLRSNSSEEVRGPFLIVFTLIITVTYQTGLQPPGGDHSSKDPTKQAFFVLLWLSNTLGFYCSLFYTFSFLPLRGLFTSWYISIGILLGVSYALAVAANSPDPVFFLMMTFVIFLLYVLYLILLAVVGRRKNLTVVPEPHLSWFRKP
ncbi:ankyrin repeat-containing protein BDA1-like isoform X1 [Brassica rapa]|uniref:ankyrin repeat-containing protein BDA1-like isoform X1 n=1 Tax=Brassica campestris TaxID=3711 RepID=UPI0004F1A525|nr:ankyrin repeat-containing protein BDA1-like isoform X1 [Brassica rapa]